MLSHQHALWIEQVSAKMRIPVWAGASVFCVVTFLLFPLFYFIAGDATWRAFLSGETLFVGILLVPVGLLLILAVYVRKNVASLEQYASSMTMDSEVVKDSLTGLSSIKFTLITLLVLEAIISPIFVLNPPAGITFLQNLVIQPPWIFLLLPIATLSWVWGYSMVGIYRIGKLPMTLRPFTEDKTLGLKPFASASLRFTAIFYGVVLLFVVIDFTGGLPPVILLRDGALALFGLLLFFLPLLSLHRKLVQAKKEKLDWINRRYTRLLVKVEAIGDAPIDIEAQQELSSIDKFQRDIHTIKSWPFDTGVLAKLITIVLSVSAILLSKVVAPLFGLG